MPLHYGLDAAKLLLQCLEELDDAAATSAAVDAQASHRLPAHLSALQDALLETEGLLVSYFHAYLEKERMEGDLNIRAFFDASPPTTLASSIRLLKNIRKHKRKALRDHAQLQKVSVSGYYEYPQRTTADSLLIRLITMLQLCWVRMEDATGVLMMDRPATTSTLMSLVPSATTATTSLVGILAAWTFMTRGSDRQASMRSTSSNSADWISILVKVSVSGIVLSCARSIGQQKWAASKITSSTSALQEWNCQWTSICPKPPGISHSPTASALDLNDTEQARLLVEFALKEPRKTTLWRTTGELRFFMLKRAMDIFYASVEAAMEVTHAQSASDWQLLGATAAAASFYSTPGTGASQRVAAITSSSQAAGDLIRNAWGMVSLPAVKNLSLQASRFLKGAAVADRIELCGVSCFVLSKDPAPELATSIDSFKRVTGMTSAPSLATIEEEEEHIPDAATCSSKPFARSTSLSRYRQRDVIFHLTGGGFFAHIIASDLPYLMDWSSATGAVVICPEYALLPEHCFPDALHEITNVYSALVSGDAAPQLGFEVNRIVVTGESAGGNLAAALCVELSRQTLADSLVDREDLVVGNGRDFDCSDDSELQLSPMARLPDALMLSCPVLNLSSELSPSRMTSTQDPVMPGSVISAISNAYIPYSLGVSRKDPLVSPIFASDDNLKLFPPTLLFASSNDPVLDDAVELNRRLRSLGVASELQVADNLPHAYLGLGTTGFPEAVQVQKDCQSWLVYQLTRMHSLDEDSSNSW